MSATGFKADLTNCDRESIHVLGNIQPIGFLVTAGMDWIVRRASASTAAFLKVEAEKLLGTPLAALFSEKALHAIRNRITLLRGQDTVERLFHLGLTEGGPPFDVGVRRMASRSFFKGRVEDGHYWRMLCAALEQQSDGAALEAEARHAFARFSDMLP